MNGAEEVCRTPLGWLNTDGRYAFSLGGDDVLGVSAATGKVVSVPREGQVPPRLLAGAEDTVLSAIRARCRRTRDRCTSPTPQADDRQTDPSRVPGPASTAVRRCGDRPTGTRAPQ
jgi:hypothetical protein